MGFVDLAICMGIFEAVGRFGDVFSCFAIFLTRDEGIVQTFARSDGDIAVAVSDGLANPECAVASALGSVEIRLRASLDAGSRFVEAVRIFVARRRFERAVIASRLRLFVEA